MNSLLDVSVSIDGADSGLYPGDRSRLPLDTRKALCKLLSGPFMDADHPSWPALLRDEETVRSRLSELFLQLVVDRERKVAFTRQADTGELDTPVLLRSKPLTFLESVLLLDLRRVLIEAEGQDQRAVVAAADIAEQLNLYAGALGADAVTVRKRVDAAIDKLRGAGMLRALRGGEKRYEVSPVLRLLFTVEDVEALGKIYQTAAKQGYVQDQSASEDDDDE
ncbi:hypothetical protein A7A76_16740 [Lysobacter enzymogenes]|uniref:DUF4194 domain-containing protein n=1 Tax=Lysobacter enzymogenes TaxID=69 RepID=UPI0019D2E01C|nr:DUF4194 domain-containing protein [Lysobacter enzymogenes]MBN7136385.1 hypothetical protein [Lysobacter enzymogenes]